MNGQCEFHKVFPYSIIVRDSLPQCKSLVRVDRDIRNGGDIIEGGRMGLEKVTVIFYPPSENERTQRNY